jgi:hypothetical protein
MAPRICAVLSFGTGDEDGASGADCGLASGFGSLLNQLKNPFFDAFSSGGFSVRPRFKFSESVRIDS